RRRGEGARRLTGTRRAERVGASPRRPVGFAAGMATRIVILPGDGIGPEIMAPTVELLRQLGSFEFEEHTFGGASIDAHGVPLTAETLAAARGADAVLLAAVGGPRWDTTDPGRPRPEQGLLGLRKGLDLFANLRPAN